MSKVEGLREVEFAFTGRPEVWAWCGACGGERAEVVGLRCDCGWECEPMCQQCAQAAAEAHAKAEHFGRDESGDGGAF